MRSDTHTCTPSEGLSFTVNAGSQDAEVEITVMILEFILGIKVVKLQMREEAKL